MVKKFRQDQGVTKLYLTINNNHKDGVWLDFGNSKSVNVVITRLQRIKRQLEKHERTVKEVFYESRFG